VVVGIRPGAIRFQADGIRARVELIENLGDMALLDLDVSGTRLRARVSDGGMPREGDVVHIAARDHDLHLFDAVTGQRLEGSDGI
jgi:ABC-type sugar transport system ATPase subunit